MTLNKDGVYYYNVLFSKLRGRSALVSARDLRAFDGTRSKQENRISRDRREEDRREYFERFGPRKVNLPMLGDVVPEEEHLGAHVPWE